MLVDNIKKLRSKGYSYSEIAAELGCSKSTVAYHIGEGQKEKSKARRLKSKPHPLQKKIWDFCRVNGGVIMDEKITLQDVLDKIGPEPKCYLTGDPIDINDPKQYSLDHRVPRSKGGRNTLDNLELATKNINQSKHSMSLDDFYTQCRKVVDYREESMG